MKKAIVLIAAMVTTLAAMAADRFYIPDFSIQPGETMEVEIMLDNETAYTALQADIYLPEGLTIEQEDGEYIFDLTDRKALNHTVSSTALSDSGIRILIASQTSKTFSGNSGALVVFNLTAAGSLTGPQTITMRNIIASEPDQTVHELADDTCNVNGGTPGPGPGPEPAGDRFYIPDFTIQPGETMEVEIMLDNETAYTALQADIYLPEGLTIEQEDDEYIFDLTDRKALNHTVSSTALSDGGIRILIASQTSKTFSGNSGALVVFNLTADGSLTGPQTITMRNIIASEPDQTVHELADATCNVTVAGSTPQPELDKVLIIGSYDEEWTDKEELELSLTPAGTYVLADKAVDNGFEFKVVARYTDQSEKWLSPASDGNFLVNDEQLNNELALAEQNPNMYFENPGTFTFTVAADLSTLVISGEFDEPEPPTHGNPFDVNHDGAVDVGDVNTVLADILAGGTTLAYDVNGDGAVDVGDVNAILNAILNGNIVTYRVNGVVFKMVNIDGGTFTMGASPEQESYATDKEKPAHQVTVSDFMLGQTEVTQELWQAVMGTTPSGFGGDNQRPVESVSWDDCVEFINQLNALTGEHFRMPTEAEWEFAARGGNKSQGYIFPGSNNIEEIAWYSEICYSVGSDSPDYGTHPVATKKPNELKLYDMTGNVKDWCSDWYGPYDSKAQTNPKGPATGTRRVNRGGSWRNIATSSRTTSRYYDNPTKRVNYIGLRLANRVKW